MASARDTQHAVPHDHDGHAYHGPEPHGELDHDHATEESHGDHEHRHEHGQAPAPAHGAHKHAHDHERHTHEPGGLLGHLPFFHAHSHGEAHVDAAMESQAGIRTVKLSLALLAVTAGIQLVVAMISGSVGLLADTIHNATDALTALPLWLAFALAGRAPNRRYTYGYGRAEDLAGVAIVLMIAASAVLAAWQSVQKLLHPQPLDYVGWVIAAALVGVAGNEAVAELRLRTGRAIGSAALVADGQHARIDGLTSLAVLIGAAGSALGLPLADPIVGLLITVAILFIVRDTALTMWHRMMDAVDPDLIAEIEQVAAAVPGVAAVDEARARYLGHRLYADLRVAVRPSLDVAGGHRIAEEVSHALLHAIPRLAEAHVHVDPADDQSAHTLTSHHNLAAPP
jgi:cation diffusion facilitator family transporter